MRYIDAIETRRRYTRSIHLERDLADAASLDGYTLTPRALETLALFCERYHRAAAVRAFTVTAVYGAGKSAFMHFLLSLLAPEKSAQRAKALQLLKQATGSGKLYRFFADLPQAQPEFVRAVAVSRAESIAVTLARALVAGTKDGKSQSEKKAQAQGVQLLERAQKGLSFEPQILIETIRQLAAERPVLIAIDELGKNLEQAAVGENDVYLLQMLAELPQQKYPVYFFGLLHSAFSDYGARLGAREQAEWQKVQGRFEDIPFLERSENTLQLIAAALSHAPQLAKIAARVGGIWQQCLKAERAIWARLFPLHPLAARALPMLCARFGQNERSLFNFLTGHEPHSFHAFLSETTLDSAAPRLLRLHHLYDYFIEAASPASIERLTRLIELRDRVRANEYLDELQTELLRTIAVLNALNSGELRASQANLLLAMSDLPGARDREVSAALKQLVARRTITYRRQADEYRLWAGSENDVEALIERELARVPKNLAEPLNAKFALRTVVAARHSFESGTLRYFPALFVDDGEVGVPLPKGDGYVLYDISETKSAVREKALHGLPVIRIASGKAKTLRLLAREVLALESLMHGSEAISLDAVARREVSERYYLMAERLRELIGREYTILGKGTRIECNPPIEKVAGTLSQVASALCDRVYNSGFRLKNELINRQQLSSQIARARGTIVAQMLKYRENAAAHFSGNGPEVSIFRVLTEKQYRAGLEPARKAIADFAGQAKEAKPLAELFRKLAEPPYGIRLGVIPLLLVQFLLENEDTVSLYHEGSFVPEITPELLEILVRRPERFALKKFAISGLEAQYFAELVKVFGGTSTQRHSLLAVIKPLMRFSRQLPRYTQQTRQLSDKAQRLRAALAQAREPDTLLFQEIPRALGVALAESHNGAQSVQSLTRELTKALHELQNAYPALLDECRSALADALRVPQGAALRPYLAAIAGLFAGQIIDPHLRRFLSAVLEKNRNDEQWLEGVIMVIADKPAEAWRDEDRNTFAANLAALAQKFLNVHQLAAKVQAAGNGKFAARLVSITDPEGREAREVVWLDAGEQKLAEKLIADLVALPFWHAAPARLRQAVLATLLQQEISAASEQVVALRAESSARQITIERRSKSNG